MSITRTGTGATSDRLRAALAALGIDAAVLANGRVAVLRTSAEGVARLRDDQMRRMVVDAARAEGFANVAIELLPDATSRGG